MKITRIRIFKTDLPYVGGAYVWGAGNAIEVANLGGLSKARRVRDYLVENRIPVVCEDTWGGEITSTVVSHFAASTLTEYLQNTTDLMNYNTRSTGLGGAWAKEGNLFAPDYPGLGVTSDFDNLGAPVSEYLL